MHEGHAVELPALLWAAGWLVAVLVLFAIGLRLPLATGLGAVAGRLYATACVVAGLGAGMAFNPVLLAAMSDVEPTEAGLASGVVNTSFMMGGALGLAVLASVAAARTGGDGSAAALVDGYQAAFIIGAVFAVAAGAVAAVFFRGGPVPVGDPHAMGEPAIEAS